MREYVARLLAERYDVTAVADGMQALAAARRQPPDLVLSDVMMPGLDGFGLLRELRADPATAAMPVILLVGPRRRGGAGRGARGRAPTTTSPSRSAPASCWRASPPTSSWPASAASPPAASASSAPRPSRILESITDGFLALDRDWRITYVNAEAERINRQADASEMLGRDHWELFPATVGTRLEAEFRRAVAEQVSVQFETLL